MTTNEQKLADKAFWKKEIRYLLLPYYSTRAQVEIWEKQSNGSPVLKKYTYYANEHLSSYGQLLNGYTDKVLLSRLFGFDQLIDFIENKLGHKLQKAVIYQRLPGSKTFDKLLRRYYRKDGKVELEQSTDHGYHDADILELSYQVINGRVVIIPPEHAALTQQIRDEIQNPK